MTCKTASAAPKRTARHDPLENPVSSRCRSRPGHRARPCQTGTIHRLAWRSRSFPDGTLDPEVLRIAADVGRLLVSRDARTLPRHFDAFIASRRSPGIILIPSGIRIGDAIERLLIAWLTWTAEEIENQIRWLPDS